MKHMWKKNQIIITALAALVAVAGYLNYSGTKLGENALPASTTETEATLTDIDSLDQDITLTDSADGEVYLGEAAAGETDGMSDAALSAGETDAGTDTASEEVTDTPGDGGPGAAGRRQTAQRMCGGSCRRSRAASEDHDVLQYAVFPDDRHCHRIAWKIEERGEKMSAEIRSWVRSILCCLCLMQLAEQILPDNHYQKYIRLFCGVLFLILLISPLTDQAHLTAVFEKQWQQALQLEEWDSIRMEQENLSDLRSRVLTEACQKEVQRQIEETADGEGMKGTKVKVVFQSEETEGIRKVTISGGYEDLQQKEAVQEQILQKLWEIYQISSDKVVFLGG